MRIDLNGTWILSGGPADHVRGTVPGSVYGDLLAAGLMKDPFDQDNEYEARELMVHDYVYERDFDIPAALLPRFSFLVCDGIDTLGELRVNGILVGTTDNMHRRWRFPLRGVLAAGKNHIEVTLRSSLRYIRERHAACPHDFYQAGDAVKGFIHLRKGSSMFGWDWGPQLPDAGIWRDIRIESYASARLADVVVRQDHRPDGSVGLTVDVSAEVFAASPELAVEFVLKDPDDAVIGVEEAVLEHGSAAFATVVENARKWQPAGYGGQPLYTAIVFLRHGDAIEDSRTLSVGLRTVAVIREDDAFGQSFTFAVNGVRIFAKGADYIPEDNLLGRMNPERSFALLSAAKAANHNMVRVWGGGIYPADSFFDGCDRLGLLVWQDLMFACAVYDMDDAPWVQTMVAEIEDNLARIRHHASLSLICGNNENETAIEHWNVPSRELSKKHYVKQYLETIAPIVAKTVPDVPWWPSSPSSGGEPFDGSNADGRGDMHYWGVWHSNEPITSYRKYHPRFMSEFGIQSFPALKTVATFAREQDMNIFSYVMEQHQKNKTANDKILSYVGKMFRYPKDFESLLYVSQLIQAEGVRYGVEHWRRNYGRCMGALYWQLNDCWPVASWSGIDYFSRWKALHYHAKKFFAPVLLSLCEEGTNVSVHLTNDGLAPIRGTVRWKLSRFDGTVLEDGAWDAAAPAQAAVEVGRLSFDLSKEERFATVLSAAFSEDGAIVAENLVSFAPDKHLNLTEPAIRVVVRAKRDRFEVTLTASAFAKFVELSLPDADPVFSDNYFCLLAGEKKTVSCPAAGDPADFRMKLRVRSLHDTY
ncbi:MAG: glycoside hydrolase family 2 protein [Candidatus Izemoplasmatales bacterium]